MMKTANTAATRKAQWKVFERRNCACRIGSRRPNLCGQQRRNAAAAIRKSWYGAKNETGAADIVNHGGLVGPVHLVAQAAHMHVDKIGSRDEFIVPDFLEQHGPRQQLVAALHHVLKQSKLARQ